VLKVLKRNKAFNGQRPRYFMLWDLLATKTKTKVRKIQIGGCQTPKSKVHIAQVKKDVNPKPINPKVTF
jgi:hypothetical protein